MSQKRVSLYERIPEIYRIKDKEQIPPDQLENFVGLVEDIYSAIHENIESLYHDFFIETCDDWVIPYIADLLGTSHLKGDPWTLRADVADTIALRRRKGTLGAIELLTYDLTKWGVHAAELRKNLVWSQHLNHQRPDAGGQPPYGDDRPPALRPTTVRGGTVALRDPAMLALLSTPFDPYAYVPDLNRAEWGQLRYNLPNLAIFLWRLEAYSVPGSKPIPPQDVDASYTYTHTDPDTAVETDYIGVRFHVHPLGQAVRLFNTGRFDPDRDPPVLTQVDEVPGPIHPSRLTSGSQAGNPEDYIAIDTYDHENPEFNPLTISDVGLHFHVPEDYFPAETQWSFYGADLEHWNLCLPRPLNKYQVAIDPKLGRIIVAVESEEQRDALLNYLRLTFTYGAVGSVGAHPVSRAETTVDVEINLHTDPTTTLQSALNNLHDKSDPWVIEIQDSLIHDLDLSVLDDSENEDGGPNLCLKKSLTIRAANDQRPMIRLAQPLRFRPTTVVSTTGDDEEQAIYDALMHQLNVRLEGVCLCRADSFPADEPLIARAAVNSLELYNCTLDPGGQQLPDGSRLPIQTAMRLASGYGFNDEGEEHSEFEAFNQVPEIILHRTISGPLHIDQDYNVFLTDTILDAGLGREADLSNAATDFAITAATDAMNGWGPKTRFNGITVFGAIRVEQLSGKGAIFVHAVEVMNNQQGCIKFSCLSEDTNRIPQSHACVSTKDVDLFFTSEIFGEPAYGQLAHASDYSIREQGPNDDQMGAYGFLLEAHKWRNLQIRYREFMPVGIRPLLIPVT